MNRTRQGIPKTGRQKISQMPSVLADTRDIRESFRYNSISLEYKTKIQTMAKECAVGPFGGLSPDVWHSPCDGHQV